MVVAMFKASFNGRFPVLLVLVACFALGLLLWADSAFAQVASLESADGMINEIGRRFQGQLAQWGTTLHTAATRIFWFLALISLVWMAAQMILRKGDISDVLGELTRYVMFLGFYWWLLQNAVDGANIANGLVDGLRRLGDQASGFPAGWDVTQLAQRGLDVLGRAIDALDWTEVDTWFGFLLALAVLVAFVLVAVNFVLVKFGAYILIYAGIIYLGFGGARWTSDIALNYFKACVAQGIKLLTMSCIISASIGMLDEYYAMLGEGPIPLRTIAGFFIVAIVLCLFITKVPDMLAGVMSGHVTGHGMGNFGVGAAAAAVSAAIAPMMWAGKEMMGMAYAMIEAGKAASGSGEKGSGDSGGRSGSIADSSGPGGAGGGAAGGAAKQENASAAMGGSGSAAAAHARSSDGGRNTPDVSRSSRTEGPSATSSAASNQPAGSGSIGGGGQSPETTFFGALAGGIKDSVRNKIETSSVSGRIGGAIRDARLGNSSSRELASQGKGTQAANKEPNPQAELDAFIKGR